MNYNICALGKSSVEEGKQSITITLEYYLEDELLGDITVDMEGNMYITIFDLFQDEIKKTLVEFMSTNGISQLSKNPEEFESIKNVLDKLDFYHSDKPEKEKWLRIKKYIQENNIRLEYNEDRLLDEESHYNM